jgi:hypothetical protein
MIDIEIDWCARADKLRRVELALLSGEMVTEARFGQDMSRFASASLSDVQTALKEARANCAIQRGKALPRRTRFAISGRMRPY